MAGVQNTLYVGNIPGGATEEAVMALFQSCGQIQQVRLAGDPSYQNRFAFVQFQDQNQANMGLSMDGMTFMDRQLKVSIARTPLTNPALAAAAGQQPQQGYGAYGQQQPRGSKKSTTRQRQCGLVASHKGRPSRTSCCWPSRLAPPSG